MARRSVAVCKISGCPELRPCPVDGHEPRSRRRAMIGKSGWQQQKDARRILRAHRFVCHVCGQFGAMQVDHVIPVFEGGPDTDENKRPIHAEPCHREKTAAEAARARRRRG